MRQGEAAFVDSGAWIALALSRDPLHASAREHWEILEAAEITKAVRTPDVTQKFIEQFNMEILTSSPEDFAAYQKSEQERWFKVIKENDIRGD